MVTTGAIAVLPYVPAARHSGRARLGYLLVPAVFIRAVQLTWDASSPASGPSGAFRGSPAVVCRDGGVLAAYGHANCGRPTYGYALRATAR